MPTYEVFIDGKPRKTELTKIGERTFSVKLNNKTINAELSTDKLDLEKKFSIKIEDKKYHVELAKTEDQKIPVKVEEATFKAEVKTSAIKQTSKLFEPTSITPQKKNTTFKPINKGSVTAPMTGKILSIKVKNGDMVKAGQILCVLEAMKMENEITAPKSGKIREVHVSEGSSVSEGEPLLTID